MPGRKSRFPQKAPSLEKQGQTTRKQIKHSYKANRELLLRSSENFLICRQSSIAMRNCWKAEQQVGNIPRKWIGKGDMGVSQRPGGKHNKSGKFLGCDVLEIKLV